MAEAESDSRETEGLPAASPEAADGPVDGPQGEPGATLAPAAPSPAAPSPVEEIGGPKGAEPTRYGDWERNGRCFDF